MVNELILTEIKKIFKRNLTSKDMVLLAGSFSRGEESFLKKGNVIIPLSDIEFIIFQNTSDFLLKKNHDIIRKMLKEKERKFHIKIDFSMKPKIFLRYVPNTFFWYETFATSKTIYGKEINLKINNINEGDIYEVLNHSIISIILKKNLTQDKNVFKYQILKASLDLLIPFLYYNGFVVITHKKRYEKFKDLNVVIDNNIVNLLEIACNIKCKKGYISYKELEELDEKFLLDTYLKFSLYLFNLINRNTCRIGDKSVVRLIYHFKTMMKNINYLMVWKDKNFLCNVYKLNYTYLSKQNNFDVLKYFNLNNVSFQEVMKINKLTYRYLK